jgi:glycosyltransferase involved in cell wall biosynthesis
MQKLFSIIIPTHNRSKSLLRTLNSIADLEEELLLLNDCIVVGNRCDDDTQSVVEIFGQTSPFRTRFLNEPQLGLNVARNAGVRLASTNRIILIDDDVVLQKGFLSGYSDVYCQHKPDIVAGKTILDWRDANRPEWLGDELLNLLSYCDKGDNICELTKRTDAVGANFSFTRQIWAEIGGFRTGVDREGQNLLGGGETDFIERALNIGAKFWFAPTAVANHIVAPARMSTDYFSKVSFGTELSYVLLKRPFGFQRAVRTLLYHTFQVAKHAVGLCLARCIGDKRTIATRKVRINGNLGAIKGVALKAVELYSNVLPVSKT